MKKLSTLFIALFIITGAWSQIPEKMSYQAIVRDGSDQLVVNQSVGMQISILQGTPSGTVVYEETHTPEANANGLVSIEIGEGTVISGTFSTIDWSDGPYFIKTETDPDGGTDYTISGTSQLLSVPYALYAKTAENGFSGDYNDLTNKPAISISPWQIDDDNIYYNDGWLSIGTAASLNPLTISNSNNTCYINLDDNQGASGMRLGAYMGDLAFINDNVNDDIFFTVRKSSGYDRRMTISGTTGNIGIGDATPDASLDVEGTVKVGVNGISFSEIVEITGTTQASGTATTINYPSGYTQENTRVLSLEINYSGTFWNSMGMFYQTSPRSIGCAMSSSVIFIHYPDASGYLSKDFRLILMKVE